MGEPLLMLMTLGFSDRVAFIPPPEGGLADTICCCCLAQRCYSWTRASKLSLPLSTALPALTTFLPLILSALTPLIAILKKSQSNTPAARRPGSASGQTTLLATLLPSFATFLTFLDQLLTALPAILVAISATYFTPTNVSTCRLDNQWQGFWSGKDGDAIRGIEERLKCCGYRSVHDRAWPFPGTSAGSKGDCVNVLGYNKPCIEAWAKEEKSAAVGVFVSAVLGFLLKVILSSRQFGSSGQVRRGNLRGPTFPARAITARPTPSSAAPAANPAAASGDNADAEEGLLGGRYRDNVDEEEHLQNAAPVPEGGNGAQGQGERDGEGRPPASSHSHSNPEEHDILHGGFRDASR
ncbi:tetraspanin [Ascosphaera apis ARSEF 7405]|uniref:Tetraspanin n=1 Tax=Ascosphaera apis ARSEF 7405 TaxID=392613 RepID=A0A167XSA4_9EURO|nr:tetraspanin [Ascosphaera apis ARSEF 7405]